MRTKIKASAKQRTKPLLEGRTEPAWFASGRRPRR